MPHPAAAMFRSSSSILRLSRRLQLHLRRPGTPRLPSPPLSARPRFLSSSSSSPPDGVGWTSYDPFTDTLSPPAAAPSASDSETPAESGTWGVYDSVAGRIVIQGASPRAPSSRNSDNDDEEVDKAGDEKKKKTTRSSGKGRGSSSAVAATPSSTDSDSVDEEAEEEEEEKGKRTRSGGMVQGCWSAMAVPRKAKAGKQRVYFVCSKCGEAQTQWWGICPHCQGVGTLNKFLPGADPVSTGGSNHAVRSWIPQMSKEMVPQSLHDVNKGFDQTEWRIPLTGIFGMEISRVLGGGIVPGSLILVGGDPGVGKSSLMLQVALNVLEGFNDEESSPVVYVSGEESIEQIGNRASRMNITSKNLYLYSGTDIEDILDKIQPLSPKALIIDSIQTVYLASFVGSAGNLVQVKECTSALLRFAKLTNIPVFVIGHVNKTGDIAGPRLLEHIVDVVLYMEGETCSSHRLLRSVKNRFGSTDELGVFEMSEFGLQAVLNPSEMFLTEHDSDSEVLAGLAVAVILDGSRPFAIEVQALCVSGSFGIGQAVGMPSKRADLLISVLMKQAGLKLENNTIFINVVSGFQLTETAGDLAIAASICSRFQEWTSG